MHSNLVLPIVRLTHTAPLLPTNPEIPVAIELLSTLCMIGVSSSLANTIICVAPSEKELILINSLPR